MQLKYLCPLTLGLMLSATSMLRGQGVTFIGATGNLPSAGVMIYGTAIDGAGDVFIVDLPCYYGPNCGLSVLELPRTATGYGPPTTLPISAPPAEIIAADAAGDLFFPGYPEVVEFPRTATGYGPQILLPNPDSGAISGITLDGAGDIFLANRGHNTIVELPRTAEGYGPEITLPTSGSFHPWGVAVDLAGDVFFSDTDEGRILELPRTPTGYGPQVTLPTVGLIQPEAIAVDSAGDLFIADLHYSAQAGGEFLELPRTATGYGPQKALIGPSDPTQISVDNAGDVFSYGIDELQTRSVNLFGGLNVCSSGQSTPAPCRIFYYEVTASGTLGAARVLTGGEPNLDFTLFLNQNSCTGPVSAGAICTAAVAFNPTAPGERGGVLQITDTNGHVLAATPIYGNAPLSGFAVTPMILNGSSAIAGTTLELTSGAWDSAASAFAPAPVDVRKFATAFDFRLTDPKGDGFTFTLQNAGPNAIGSIGGGLGYAHIAKSVAVKFDLYSNDGEGPNSTGLYLNGAAPNTPAIDLTGTGIDLHSGDRIHAALDYDGATLTLTLTDTATSAAWSHAFQVDIPAAVGANTAYAGFTGSSGSDTAIQQILNWTFTPKQ